MVASIDKTITAIENKFSGVWTAQELVQKMDSGELKFIETEYDLRTSRDLKDYYEALKVINNEYRPMIQILHPITVYEISEDNTLGILNGNSRVEAFIQMYKSGKFMPEMFKDVSYINVGEITKEQAYQYQQKSNDTTIRHSIVDKIRKAYELYVQFYVEELLKTSELKEYVTLEQLEMSVDYKTRKACSKKSTDKCKIAFGNINNDIFSKLKTISQSGDVMLSYIENENIEINLAYEIIKTLETLKEKNGIEYTLNSALTTLYQIAEDDNSVRKNVIRILPTHLKSLIAKLKASYGKSEVNEEKEATETTVDASDDVSDSEVTTSGEEIIKPAVTKEEMTALSQSFRSTLSALNIDDIAEKSENKDKLNFIVVKGAGIIAKVLQKTDYSQNADLLGSILNILSMISADIDIVEGDKPDVKTYRAIQELTTYLNQPPVEPKPEKEKVEKVKKSKKAKAEETEVIELNESDFDEDSEVLPIGTVVASTPVF